jgi:energy-coupling factor transporter ATP-binding protein EcfA2
MSSKPKLRAVAKAAGAVDPRLQRFRDKKVGHVKAKACLNELILLTENPRPESIIVLIGPGGSGKTTLLGRLKKHLANFYQERMAKDPGFLPFLSIEAVAGLDGTFNWKDGLTRVLAEAGEVLINQKAISRFEVELDGEAVSRLRSLVREELRRALENLVKSRDVPLLIVDEASALLMTRKRMSPLLPFEILKSLAVVLKIPIVLSGAYDLLGILDGTGQLVRRSDVVHLSRYLAEGSTEDFVEGRYVSIPDREHFRDALHSLLNAMEIEKETDFTEHVDYFMMKSVSCVGNLKDWLDRAFVKALAQEKPVLTLRIIKRTALKNKLLIKLTNEAILGEKALAETPDDELARLQGWKVVPQMPDEATLEATPVPSKRRRGNRSPGKRGPSRDKVGGLDAP